MFDVLVHRLPIEQVIQTREIDIAVASIDLAGAELALSALIGRERALEKALVDGARPLRLHPHRHAAVARPADDQRVRRGDRRDRARCSASTCRCAGSSSSRTRSRWCARTSTRSVAIVRASCRRCTTGARCTRARRSRSSRRTSATSSTSTRIRKTVRYAEAPVKGSSVLKYDPTGAAAAGVPRPREGGARWRESARRCVRARSPSSSARPRRRSAPRRARAEPSRRPSTRGRGRARRDRRARPRLRDASRRAARPSSRARAARLERGPRRPSPTRCPPRPPRAPRRATSRRCSSRRRSSTACRRRRAPRYIAAIRVVGVGGAGLNAIHRMIDAGIAQVDFVAVNTDRQALAISDAPTKISIGEGADAGSRLRRRSGDRSCGRRGGDGPAARGAPRLRHGLRHGRRGRRHGHRRCARGRADRARARRAHRRDRDDAVPVRGHAPAGARPRAASRSSGPRATRSSSSRTTGCSRCSTARPRWSTPSRSPTTCCGRACRGSAT